MIKDLQIFVLEQKSIWKSKCDEQIIRQYNSHKLNIKKKIREISLKQDIVSCLESYLSDEKFILRSNYRARCFEAMRYSWNQEKIGEVLNKEIKRIFEQYQDKMLQEGKMIIQTFSQQIIELLDLSNISVEKSQNNFQAIFQDPSNQIKMNLYQEQSGLLENLFRTIYLPMLLIIEKDNYFWSRSDATRKIAEEISNNIMRNLDIDGCLVVYQESLLRSTNQQFDKIEQQIYQQFKPKAEMDDQTLMSKYTRPFYFVFFNPNESVLPGKKGSGYEIKEINTLTGCQAYLNLCNRKIFLFLSEDQSSSVVEKFAQTRSVFFIYINTSQGIINYYKERPSYRSKVVDNACDFEQFIQKATKKLNDLKLYKSSFPNQIDNRMSFLSVQQVSQVLTTSSLQSHQGDLSYKECCILLADLALLDLPNSSFFKKENQPDKREAARLTIIQEAFSYGCILSQDIYEKTIIEVIKIYTKESYFYRQLNKCLMNGRQDYYGIAAAKIADRMIRVLNKLQNNFSPRSLLDLTEQLLYRGFIITSEQFQGFKNKDYCAFYGFTSCTKSLTVAQQFINYKQDKGKILALLKIVISSSDVESLSTSELQTCLVPLDIKNLSAYKGEFEVLFPPFSNFQIGQAQAQKSGNHDYQEIYLLYLGTRTPDEDAIQII